MSGVWPYRVFGSHIISVDTKYIFATTGQEANVDKNGWQEPQQQTTPRESIETKLHSRQNPHEDLRARARRKMEPWRCDPGAMQEKHCTDSQPAFLARGCSADLSRMGGQGTPGPAADSAGSPAEVPLWRTKMFGRERCSKTGCFLEAVLPVVAPAVALLSMLSLLAFS
jgi:hypothetical protein